MTTHDLSNIHTTISAPTTNESAVEYLQELEPLTAQSILNFGSSAQAQMTAVANQMLDGVQSKDTGAAGSMLSEMIATLKGFDVQGLDPNKELSWWDKLLRKTKPIVLFQQRYDEVNNHIETIALQLEKHKESLLHDIKSLDKLYDGNLAYFHELEAYINAGETKLAELDTVTLPDMTQRATASESMLEAQELQNISSQRDDLERRIHDLHLTRQVAMQSLPSLRLVQENNKGLVNKISSTLVNTLPLWRQQLAQAVTIYRSQQASNTLTAATDLTNDLLETNANNLKTANTQARKQIERGVFDITSVQKANTLLIETIEESLQISTEGKHARAQAITALTEAEQSLKAALLAASHHQDNT